NPVLRHVLPDGAQTTQDLPRPVNIIYAPPSVPGAIVFLGRNQISNRLLHAGIAPIEVDVPKQFECPSREVTTGRIQNGFVMGEWHVLQPAIDHIFVEGAPAAVTTLETQLPG